MVIIVSISSMITNIIIIMIIISSNNANSNSDTNRQAAPHRPDNEAEWNAGVAERAGSRMCVSL